MQVMKPILLAVVLTTSSLQAQDFGQLLKEIRDDYARSQALLIAMEITVYDSAHAAMPYYQQLVDIKREGNNYWYRMEEHEMLMNDKYLIVVDNRARQISCSKRSVAAENGLQKQFQFDLDSLLKYQEVPILAGSHDGLQHYVVNQKIGPIEKIHFYIQSQSHTLKQIDYKYREGQYVTIRFIIFNKQPLFEAGTFSEAKYVVMDEKKLVVSRYFKGYGLQYE